MFDGMKMQDVALCTDQTGAAVLLTNDRLTFGALVDPATGFVIDPTRRAFDRGLTFRLIPRRTGEGQRVEVKGSLHKFYNRGEHNANQFTATNLLLTLDQLVTGYGIDPFTSQINTLEFGVNVVLPFPVSQVLQNLICYKNKPFTCDTRSRTPYYECRFQRFTVKLYDKGKQRGLDENLLRVEIKVAKMIYFDHTGVYLNTLSDLLTVANYEPLGALLVNTFNKILFDDPTINPDGLTTREREIYQKGRNPRYWQIPDDLPPVDRPRLWKQLQRAEGHYRAIIDHYGRANRQAQTTALIAETWNQLTTVTDELLTQIDDYRATWQTLTTPNILPALPGPMYNKVTPPPAVETCPLLTDVSNGAGTGKLSTFNPLYSALQPDMMHTPTTTHPEPVTCPVTGVSVPNPTGPGGGVRRFVSAAMLRHDDDLLMSLNRQFTSYRKGSQEDEFSRVAHNVRNADSNPRNNLRRRIERFNQKKGGQKSLFPEFDRFPLTDHQRTALDYWRGTPYEINLHDL